LAVPANVASADWYALTSVPNGPWSRYALLVPE
jgi:hypothetical protein